MIDLHQEMDFAASNLEIVESQEDLDLVHHSKGLNPLKVRPNDDEKHGKNPISMSQRSSLEDELDQLIEAIDLQVRGGYAHKLGASPLRKNPQKRPVRVGITQASGLPVSETLTLKQSLRGLCISQASELAALRRLSKPKGLPDLSDAGLVKRFYKEVGRSNGILSSPRTNEGIDNSLHLALDPGKSFSKPSTIMKGLSHLPERECSHQAGLSAACSTSSPGSLAKSLTKGEPPIPASSSGSADKASLHLVKTRKPQHDGKFPVFLVPGRKVTVLETEMKPNQNFASSASIHKIGSKVRCPNEQASTPDFRKKSFMDRKLKQDSAPLSASSSSCGKADTITTKSFSDEMNHLIDNHKMDLKKHAVYPITTINEQNSKVISSSLKTLPVITKMPIGDMEKLQADNAPVKEMSKIQGLHKKGKSSRSSESSIGEDSSSTNISEESCLSNSTCNGGKPHMSRDVRWQAIHHIERKHGSLGLRHFKLLKRLGSGDIGNVYLSELVGTKCVFALKVMDNEYLAKRKKMLRARTEREILQMLDHPFLPTLYSYFTTEKMSCLVIDYCAGGDLHALRQRQPGRCFPEQAARFYAAEVLLAIEYLHMLGIIYRDLKPENILIRDDGHIMLTDFDLSLRCSVSPTLVKSVSSDIMRQGTGLCSDSPCIDPLCLHTPCVQVSCFSPRLAMTAFKAQKVKPEQTTRWANTLPQLVAEPTEVRSNSFVGTHEYLAPEIIKGEGHGSAVDWWTFGVFLYELLFGVTPFKGPENDETLANVVSWKLKFPDNPEVSFSARDLIRRLLSKEPENRLGFMRGTAEIKKHPFFDGLSWALIRCSTPPAYQASIPLTEEKQIRSLKFQSIQEHADFELF